METLVRHCPNTPFWGAPAIRLRVGQARSLRHGKLRTQQPRQQPRQRSLYIARAQQKEPHDAVISSVDELSDGSVLLHFSEEQDTHSTEKQVKEVVSFITKPVQGAKRRSVPTDTIVELVGEQGDRNPVKGVASFVKAAMSPGSPSTNGASSAPPPTNGAASSKPSPPTLAEGAPIAPQTTTEMATPKLAFGAIPPSSETEAYESATVTYGYTLFRVLLTALVSFIMTAVSRLAVHLLKVDNGLPLRAPASLKAMGGLFLFLCPYLWFTGFAARTDTAQGPAAQGSTA